MTRLTKEQADEVARLRRKLETALDIAKEARAELAAFADTVFSEMESHVAERSESWESSDEGQRYDKWMGAWAEERRRTRTPTVRPTSPAQTERCLTGP